jgi:hypothetical protein
MYLFLHTNLLLHTNLISPHLFLSLPSLSSSLFTSCFFTNPPPPPQIYLWLPRSKPTISVPEPHAKKLCYEYQMLSTLVTLPPRSCTQFESRSSPTLCDYNNILYRLYAHYYSHMKVNYIAATCYSADAP